MAKLLDHNRRTVTNGTPENLMPFMVTAQISAYKRMGFKPAAIARASEARVKSAIRSGGRTDAKQELRMSDTERVSWETLYPLPE